jgi:hypothetical protein
MVPNVPFQMLTSLELCEEQWVDPVGVGGRSGCGNAEAVPGDGRDAAERLSRPTPKVGCERLPRARLVSLALPAAVKRG